MPIGIKLRKLKGWFTSKNLKQSNSFRTKNPDIVDYQANY